MISLSLGNSRMKDFFDVYQILLKQTLDPDTLSEAIKATFANRGTDYKENHPLFSEDFFTDRLERIPQTNQVQQAIVLYRCWCSYPNSFAAVLGSVASPKCKIVNYRSKDLLPNFIYV